MSSRSALVSALLLALPSAGCAGRSAAARPPVNGPGSEQPLGSVGPGDALSTFMILTDRSPDQLAPLVEVRAIAAKLGEAQCGDQATCSAVRAFATSTDHCRVRVIDGADTGLTPEDVLQMGRGLSDAERTRAVRFTRAVNVVCRGAARPAQLPARASLALAAYVAEKIDAAVYDLVVQRLDAASVFVRRTITTPIGAPSFNPSAHLAVHRFHPRSGGVVLETRGLQRFGLPEIDTTAVPPSAAQALEAVLTTVAVQLASKGMSASVRVTLDDVARVTDQSAASLYVGDGTPAPVTFTLAETKLESGETNHAFVRLVPPGGTGPEHYVAAMSAIFGSDDNIAVIKHDPELLAASNRAKARLPDMLARFAREKGRGARLLVKLPFDIPGREGSHEWMWVEVTSWSDTTITGYLDNEPESVPDLRAGMSVTGERAKVFDYMLRLPNGREEGGETSEILRRREEGR